MAYLLRVIADDRETAPITVGCWVKQFGLIPGTEKIWLTLTDCYWHAYRYPEADNVQWLMGRTTYRRFTFEVVVEDGDWHRPGSHARRPIGGAHAMRGI